MSLAGGSRHQGADGFVSGWILGSEEMLVSAAPVALLALSTYPLLWPSPGEPRPKAGLQH